MKGAIHRTVTILASAALLLGATACSEDDSGPEEFVQPTNISTPDVGVEDADNDDDAGDAGDEADTDVPVGDRCEDVECESGLRCVRGDCVPPDSKLACDEAVDLGTLSGGDSQTASGDTEGFVDTLDGSCVETFNGFSGAENVFRFEVDTPSLVELILTPQSSNVDWAMSVRTDGCLSGEEQTCTGREDFQFIADEGIEYFVIVEPESGVDKGAFDLEVAVTERDCATPGERTCEGDMLEICGRADTLQCAGSCESGVCEGDSCASPITVSAPTTLMGAAGAYRNDFDFADSPTCGTSPGNGLSTPGQDFVIGVAGLTQGQTLIVDASMNNDLDHAIFVLPSCDPTAECLAAIDLGDRLEYEVETDGDYFVVIDKLSSSIGDFEVAVDIQ